jgi:hypothetical protein
MEAEKDKVEDKDLESVAKSEEEEEEVGEIERKQDAFVYSGAMPLIIDNVCKFIILFLSLTNQCPISL